MEFVRSKPAHPDPSVFSPRPEDLDTGDNGIAQLLASVFCFRAIARQRAIQQNDFCGALCDRRASHQRVVCIGRDSSYSGDEPPAPRHDQGFQRTDAQGPGTSGSIRSGRRPSLRKQRELRNSCFRFRVKPVVRCALVRPLYAVCSCQILSYR